MMLADRDKTTIETTVRDDESAFSELWRRFFVFDIRIVRNFRRLWQNRYLIYALTLRGIRARYKQSLFGVGWALLTPLAMTVVVAYMYHTLNLEEKFFPCPRVIYLLFTLALWSFFTKSVTNGSTSLVANMDLVTKVYFPREVLPISSVLMNLVDLALSLFMWMIVAAAFTFLYPDLLKENFSISYPYLPHAGWLWFPVFLTLHMMLIMGIVFFASAMQVYFRDVSHLINLGLFLWLIITPVLYPMRIFPASQLTMLININPMTGIIDGYRLAVISRQSPWVTDGNWEHHVVGAMIFSITIFLIGYCFFKHEEKYFADVV